MTCPRLQRFATGEVFQKYAVRGAMSSGLTADIGFPKMRLKGETCEIAFGGVLRRAVLCVCRICAERYRNRAGDGHPAAGVCRRCAGGRIDHLRWRTA